MQRQVLEPPGRRLNNLEVPGQQQLQAEGGPPGLRPGSQQSVGARSSGRASSRSMAGSKSTTTTATRRSKVKPKGPAWGLAASALGRALQKVELKESIVEAFGSGEQGFGDEGAKQLADALTKRAEGGEGYGLLSLRVHGNAVGDEGVAALAESLQAYGKLLRLDLGSNAVGDEGASHLCGLLKERGQLQVLRLRCNRIGDAGAARLAELLQGNERLEELELGSNAVGEAGAAALAEHVGRHPTLQTLGLSDNATLGDVGASTLADALGPGTTLLALHLSKTGLGDAAATKLAEALRRHDRLKELSLDHNSVGDAACQALTDALEHHGGLRSLSLQSNKITDDSVLDMVMMLSRVERDNIVCNLKGNPVTGIRWSEEALANLTVTAKTVKNLAKRGMRLKRILKFYKECFNMGVFQPETASTASVVATIFKPETEKYEASYSEFCHTAPGEYYVIHAWRGLFRDLVKGLAMHATGNPDAALDPDHVTYLHNPEALEVNYFLDVFACYQCAKYPVGDPRRESDKIDLLLEHHRARGGEALLLVDSQHWPLTRLWCLVEAQMVFRKDMPLSVTFGTVKPMLRKRRAVAFKDAEASDDDERRYLLELIDSSRGIARDAFDPEVTDKLKEMVRGSYRAVLRSLGSMEQSELVWAEQLDEAQEELLEKTAGSDLRALQRAIEVAYEMRVAEKLVRPALRRRAVLASEACSAGPEIKVIISAIRDRVEELPAHLVEGDLACLARLAPKSELANDAARGSRRTITQGLRAGLSVGDAESLEGFSTELLAQQAVKDVATFTLAADPVQEEMPSVPAAEDYQGGGEQEPGDADLPDPQEKGGTNPQEGSAEQSETSPQKASPEPGVKGADGADGAEGADGAGGVEGEGDEEGDPELEGAEEEEEEEEQEVERFCTIDEVLWLARVALRTTKGLADEEGVDEPEINLSMVRHNLGFVEKAIAQREAEEQMLRAIEQADIEGLEKAIERGAALDVDEEPMTFADRSLKILKLEAARLKGDGFELLTAIDAAHQVGIDDEVLEQSKRRLSDVDPDRYRQTRQADLREASAGIDLERLLWALELAEQAGVDLEELIIARRKAIELELGLALEAGSVSLLHAALEKAQDAGVKHVVDVARRTIKTIELERASTGKDIDELKYLIESAPEAGVKDDSPQLAQAKRRLAELELLQVATNRKRGLSIEELQALLDRAAETGVDNEEASVPVKRKIAEMQLEQAIQADSITVLRETLQAAREMDVAAGVLRRGRKKLSSLELADAMTLDSIKELAARLAEAQEAEVDAAEIQAGRNQLAILNLREASAGSSDIELEGLLKAMSAAKEAGASREDMEAAKARVAQLDPDVYGDMRKEELEAALELGEAETLREALRHAEKAGVEEDLLLQARKILAERQLLAALIPEACGEMEAEHVRGALDTTQKAVDAGRKASLDEESSPLSEAIAQLAALKYEIAKREAHAALMEASQGTNIQAFKKAIQDAEQAGVDPAIIADMRERLE